METKFSTSLPLNHPTLQTFDWRPGSTTTKTTKVGHSDNSCPAYVGDDETGGVVPTENDEFRIEGGLTIEFAF